MSQNPDAEAILQQMFDFEIAFFQTESLSDEDQKYIIKEMEKMLDFIKTETLQTTKH